RLPTSTPSAVPGNMRPNTTSAGNWKIPTRAAAMKPRMDRLSTTRPKKPLRSPATIQGRGRGWTGALDIGMVFARVAWKRDGAGRPVRLGRRDGAGGGAGPVRGQNRVRNSTPQVRGSLRKPV